MKCPKCNDGNCKYVFKRNSLSGRTNKFSPRKRFNASCKKCGWVGLI